MCLAIASKGPKITNLSHIENAFSSNSDGAGLAYVLDGEIVIEKGFFTARDTIEAYSKVPEGSAHLLHFRLGTAGKMNETNCHPFRVSKNLAFIHNGVLSTMRTCALFSDTHYFNEDILKPLLAKRKSLIYEASFQLMLEDFIGGFNKLAFLDNEGHIIISNESKGHWVGDIWYSNHSYESYGRNFLPKHYQPSNANKSYQEEYRPSKIVQYSVPEAQSFDDWIADQLDDYCEINRYTGSLAPF